MSVKVWLSVAYRIGAKVSGAGGRGTFGLAGAYTATAPATPSFIAQNAGGEYQLGSTGTPAPLTFAPILYATDSQTLTVAAADASGNSHSTVVALNQGNAHDIDQVISSINAAIQQTNDATLKSISAVKVNAGPGTEKIEMDFKVASLVCW